MEAYHKFKNNKYLSRKPTFLQGIALIPIGLVMTYLICVLISMALCDRVVNGYMFKLAGIYTAYAAPVVLILVSVYILRASGYVKLYEDHLTYYRYCFSKKCRKIAYSDISECVVANGLRIRRGEYSQYEVLCEKAPGKPNCYCVADRSFNVSELRILKR